MRLVLATAAFALAAASAHAAEDRYGPPRTAAAAGATTPQTYAGTLLAWSGKRPAPAPAAPAAAPPPRPQMIPGGLYQPSGVAAPPVVAATGYRAGTTFPAPAAPGAPAPTGLYDRPSPLQTPASALPPPPAQAAGYGGTGGARFYSVHRDFGAQPDPIPAPPPGAPLAFRPEASISGEVKPTGVGDGVLKDGEDVDMVGMGGVGADDQAEEDARAARREAERAAARRAAAASGGGK